MIHELFVMRWKIPSPFTTSFQHTAGALWFSLELFSIDTTSPFWWIPGKRINLNHQTKKKVKGFWSFTLNASTGLKELDLLLSAVCRSPHFDSWRTDIQNGRRWLIMNIVTQSTIHEIFNWRWRWSEWAEPGVQSATLHHQAVSHQNILVGV